MSRPPFVIPMKTLEMPIPDDPEKIRAEIAYIERYGVMPVASRLIQLNKALKAATSSPRPKASGQPKHIKEQR